MIISLAISLFVAFIIGWLFYLALREITRWRNVAAFMQMNIDLLRDTVISEEARADELTKVKERLEVSLEDAKTYCRYLAFEMESSARSRKQLAESKENYEFLSKLFNRACEEKFELQLALDCVRASADWELAQAYKQAEKKEKR